MKERGKAVEAYSGSNYSDFNYSASDLPCKKHPSSSSVGICAYCLKDRLVKLVCSDCGEQRLSSCSCSEISSFPNSGVVEVGSVGRISFLIENENEKTEEHHSHSKPKTEGSEDVILLKRSSSTCVEVKRNSGFWRIGRLFRKKRGKAVGDFDGKSDMCVSDCMGISRSRSLCSFRGAGFNDLDDASDFAFSSAKISDVNGGLFLDSEKQCGLNEAEPRKSGSEPRKSGSEPRKSGFKGGLLDAEHGHDFRSVKKGGLLELNNPVCVPNKNVFGIKESDFSGLDDSAFIDLKLDLSSDSKPEFSALKISDLPISASDFGSLKSGTSLGQLETGSSLCRGLKEEDGLCCNGGSCRITVSDKGIKMGSKGHKVWKWIFRHQPGRKSASKRDENDILKCG